MRGRCSSHRLLVLGTGAMGCLLAALLSRTGEADVTMAGTWAEGLTAVDHEGVTVNGRDGGFCVPVSAVRREAVQAEFDVVLVLVKSWQTGEVAPAAVRAAGERGLIVSLQNGLGNLEKLGLLADPKRVVGGITTLGATLLGPAHVRWAGSGSVSLPLIPECGPLPHLLRGAGIVVELLADVDRLRWLKLAVNCAINPLTAILRSPNGEMLVDERAHRVLRAAAREVGEVASARGIELGVDPVARAEEVARATAANRSSMLQDIDRGRQTEIDALNGAVVAEGLRLGVATPVNAWLASSIRELESHSRAHREPRARRLWEAIEKAGAL